MATTIRKTTTACNVKEKFAEIRDAGRRLKQLVKEVCILIIIIITYLYSAFRSEDTEAFDAAQED